MKFSQTKERDKQANHWFHLSWFHVHLNRNVSSYIINGRIPQNYFPYNEENTHRYTHTKNSQQCTDPNNVGIHSL